MFVKTNSILNIWCVGRFPIWDKLRSACGLQPEIRGKALICTAIRPRNLLFSRTADTFLNMTGIDVVLLQQSLNSWVR